jgi:cyclopropane fatty-acyl-phospholipid synthase-like methyltransferase
VKVTGVRECQCFERFAERYRLASNDVTREIERAVIGADWGANGYTTKDQADLLGAVLELGPASTLLDLGSGRGWPGLYLAATTRCRVVLTDVPLEALLASATRAAAEGLAGLAAPVRTSARSLPFARASFDAIVHTDVLCCLRPKLTVLRECARLLNPGGHMAFFTIHPAEGLTASERRRASRNGPVAVSVSRPHRELLEAAGFAEVTETDYSAEFVTVTEAWTENWNGHRDEMEALWGREVVEERQRDRQALLRSTKEGILRRSLFTARRF